MIDLYFPLLPEGSLAQSVITTVWIGIWVVALLNLRFGWVLSGLVVPGYIVPLLLIKPLSAGVIIFESIVTYLIVYFISEVASKWGLWSNLFGRDRFFAILLCSVAVRLVFDGWTLPWFGIYLQENFSIPFDYRDNFHSFGLIIVTLIANQLWKPGLVRGITPLFVTILITYLITRYVFIEYTNFTLSNVSYLYEDISSSILASPKSYIILLVTALIASRMNLFYGWEFNGLLVPSLLALQWYQPTKILTSFVEAYIILVLTSLILRLPVFKNFSIEGARKLLLFFNVGFFYKFVLSFGIIYFFPEHKVSDYFGFGYLLSTLIAIKMYEKVDAALFTRATLQTSLISIFVATAIGFMLTLVPDSNYFRTDSSQDLPQLSLQTSDYKLIEFLQEQKLYLYGSGGQTIIKNPSPSQLETFEYILGLIEDGFDTNKQKILKLLAELGYTITIIEERYAVLVQDKGTYGWGIYVIDLHNKGKLSIEVPYPLATVGVMESASVLMKLSEAKVLAISGVPLHINKDASQAEINNYYTLFHTFHKYYAKNSVVQVRALTPSLQKRFNSPIGVDEPLSLLYVKGAMPTEFNLLRLQSQLENLQVRWEDETPSSMQKNSMHNGFAELFLSPKERKNLISSQLYFEKKKFRQDASVNSIEGYLQSWLLEHKLEIAEKGTQSYIKPTSQELQFFDNEILVPLYESITKKRGPSFDDKAFRDELISVSFAAESIDYKLTFYADTTKKHNYIILHEADAGKKRFWGTYVFKLEDANELMIQTPRPFYESNTFEYSLKLFEQLNARALLLSGTHPLSNDDRSSDIMLFENKQSLFNLVSQVIFRQSAANRMTGLQIRGMQNSQNGARQSILAFDNGVQDRDSQNDEQRWLFDHLSERLALRLSDGSMYSAGYDARTLQSLYLDQSLNNSFSTLWLPFSVRKQYRQFEQEDILIQQFKTLGIPISNRPFELETMGIKLANQSQCKKKMFEHFNHYLMTQDITELSALVQEKELSLKLLIDSNSNQPFVFLMTKDKRIYAVNKLNSLPPFETDYFVSQDSIREDLEKFYLSTRAMIRIKDKCEK